MWWLDLYRVQSTYTTEYGYTYILCRAAEITIDQISREIQRGELWWIQVANVWVQGWVWAWLDLVMSQSRRLKFEQLDKWMAGPRHCVVEMGRCLIWLSEVTTYCPGSIQATKYFNTVVAKGRYWAAVRDVQPAKSGSHEARNEGESDPPEG